LRSPDGSHVRIESLSPINEGADKEGSLASFDEMFAGEGRAEWRGNKVDDELLRRLMLFNDRSAPARLEDEWFTGVAAGQFSGRTPNSRSRGAAAKLVMELDARKALIERTSD
jgi:hypothetical protein